MGFTQNGLVFSAVVILAGCSAPEHGTVGLGDVMPALEG